MNNQEKLKELKAEKKKVLALQKQTVQSQKNTEKTIVKGADAAGKAIALATGEKKKKLKALFKEAEKQANEFKKKFVDAIAALKKTLAQIDKEIKTLSSKN